MKRIKKRADFGGIFSSTIAPVINGIGGVLDSTLSTQGVNQFKTEDTSTETDDTVAMRYGGNARPKCWLGAAIGAATSLASGLIGGAANRKAARKAAALRNRQNMIQDMQGRDKQLNTLYSTYLNNNDNEEDLVYRRGGTATQHPRRRIFDRGGKYNFANFANRLERNVNESDNTRVASGRRVVNARNRQYRRDNSLIGKVINYIDKSDRASQIKRKGTLTAQQYRNSKAAQTFGRYDRVNYNGKTYYIPQVQGGIAPTIGISNAGKVASFYNRLDKAKRVFSGVPSINNLRRKPNLPSLETIINGGRNNFKGISNTERLFRPNPVMPKGYKVTGLKGTQSPKEVGEGLYNYLTKRTAIVPDRGNVKPFPINSNSTYNAIRPKFYNTRTSPVYRTDNNPAYEGRIPFVTVGDRIRVGEDIIKNTKAYKTLYRLSKSDDFPKVVGYTALGVPLALGNAYGAYKLLNNTNNSKSNNINNKTNFNKPANNPKAKTQSQQVSNNTAQIAKQTPNDSTVVENNNQTPVTNNKTSNQVSPSSTQISNNKKAAKTIQRRGRTKSRVSTNRTNNNNSNNFRQNVNFEPIDDTVNGYSQVEDIQDRSYDEYKADIDAEAEARRQEVINDLLTNYNYEDRNTTDEMRYGGKARSKKRVPIKITDGGVAQKIGNNTFLLRGGSHEQVNPSGQTGIGIKVGNNEIEAEGGEVAQRVGNALRIFSAQPMINGISPAQAVEAGANKNRIFAIQEALKRNSNNNVFRNGGIKKVGPTYNPETKSWYNINGAKLKKGHGYYSQAANKFVQYNSDGTISKFTINQWAKLKGKTQSYNVGNKAIPLLGISNNGRNISFYAPKRVRNNVSPTKENSEKHEDWVNQSVNYIGNNTNKFSKEGINLAFATPYGSKEVIINGRPVSANMLDSIAYNAGLNKYNKSQLPYAFGIPAHETKNGRTIGSTTDKKQQRINYNANTFRNYGVFNSASLLNDYRNIPNNVSPYYHAVDYLRRGLYNTKDPDHRKLIYNAGIAEWNDKNFQKYWNEQGSKQYQRGLKDTAKKQYYDKLILSNDSVKNYYKRLAYKRYFRCGGRVKFAPGGKVNPIFKYNNYAGIEDLPNSNTGISSGTYNNGNLSLGQAEKTIFPKGFVSHDSSNIGSRKTDTTPIDNWWNRNGMSVNSSDWIGLGTDLAGSLALGAFNRSAYKNLKYDYKLPNYVDETPVAFDTTYHNDAQRATVERNRLNAQKIIANNTSSANTAVQRMQQSNADAMMETNKLWDEKANKEAELRNMAAQNEQQVRARNAAARNQYYQNVAEIQNKRIDAENANRLARSNAWSTSLQGLQGAANNFLNSTRQRFEDENALMATIAAGDAATPYRMMAFGTQFGPRVINAIRAMNNVESMKDPGAAPVRSNYSNDADYSAARSKWETAMRNYEYWKQRDRFLSHYDRKGRLIRRR
jgi:hypothetical protein|nr:MAG TPA: hypothetical protein [Crassvirales sp.]